VGRRCKYDKKRADSDSRSIASKAAFGPFFEQGAWQHDLICPRRGEQAGLAIDSSRGSRRRMAQPPNDARSKSGSNGLHAFLGSRATIVARLEATNLAKIPLAHFGKG
jgi:hypothetical protein